MDDDSVSTWDRAPAWIKRLLHFPSFSNAARSGIRASKAAQMTLLFVAIAGEGAGMKMDGAT